MRQILAALVALLIPAVSFAQTSCTARLVPSLVPSQAVALCREFGSAYGQSAIPSATNTYDLGSSARSWRDLWLGRNITYAATSAVVASDSIDSADNRAFTISGGGGAGTNATRGAKIIVAGNEAAVGNGALFLDGGDAANATISLRALSATGAISFGSGGGLQRWTIDSNGDLNGNSSNSGDLVIARSGRTISLQEATPASACMGVATPNGNTAVSVSTTCAVANSRVFYTRVGAIATMGTVSTTTNPNGSSFQFASTGATDTLASSVVWMIVKESA